jgi:hypothetical protein
MNTITIFFITLMVVSLIVVSLFKLREFYRDKTEDLIKVLKFGTKVLDENNIPYWLYHGTLLGVIRDKNIIRGDNDADCCIQKIYVDKLLLLADYCNKEGYKLTRNKSKIKFVHGIPIGSDYCRLTDKFTGCYLDIGIAIETRKFLSDPCSDIPNTLRQTWKIDTIFPLKTIFIFNQTFTIPNDYDSVNFAAYNEDCYNVKKSPRESSNEESNHNTHTKLLLKEFQSE